MVGTYYYYENVKLYCIQKSILNLVQNFLYIYLACLYFIWYVIENIHKKTGKNSSTINKDIIMVPS